jgi:hypothetical protein
VRRHVLDAIESGVCRGIGVALAMAKVLVEVDLTRVDGFPSLWGRSCTAMRAWYGPAREAVAAHVPAAEVLARLPLIRVFSLHFALPVARRRPLYRTSYELIGGWSYCFCFHFHFHFHFWVSILLV